jgi:RNA polymerase sigma-70 factor (ECF subfamily)
MRPDRVFARGDEALLEAWRAGDKAAGEALLRKHYVSVLRYFQLHATWVAEDLTQRTFLACAERLAMIRSGAAFRTFVFVVARNELISYVRRSATSEEHRRFVQGSPAAANTGLSTLLSRRREQVLLLRAMACLAPDLQTALALCYWEDMNSTEIGEVLEIPASTVRSRLARARDLLATHVRRLARSAGLAQAVVGDLEACVRSLVDRGDAPTRG